MALLHLLGRILFAGFFLYNGLNHLLNVGDLAGYARSKGTPAPGLAVVGSGLMLIAGGLSVLLGWRILWGVVLLSLFLVPVSLQMHDFWNEEGEAAQGDRVNFLKNMALLGALWMLPAIPRPWPYTVG